MTRPNDARQTDEPPPAQPNPRRVREMLDRQDILDCLHRYCRGIDRLDRALARSAYHDDAVDFHGEFRGGPEEFLDWVLAYEGKQLQCHQHATLNHSVELDGDVAYTETYWMHPAVRLDGSVGLAGGRYVDRLQKRAGRWAIASRACTHEWGGNLEPLDMHPMIAAFARGTRDRSDVSYRRPLRAEIEQAEP